MEIAKKPKGRPRKRQADTMTAEQFVRVPRVLSAYHPIRGRGEKHSVAVAETARREAICETEVRRILSAWQPQALETVIHFEPRTPTKDDVEKIRFFQEQLAAPQVEKGLDLNAPADFGKPKGTIYAIRFAKRPHYPRHNRKTE